MPYCEKCGHLLDKSAQRCEICGAQCLPAEPQPPAPSAKPGPPPPPVNRSATPGPPSPRVAKQAPPPVPGGTVAGSAGILPALGPQASSLPPPPPQSTVSEATAGKIPAAPVKAGRPPAQPPEPPRPPAPPRLAQPPLPQPPAATRVAPAAPARPAASVPGARSALLPVLIVGMAVVLLMIVALGGYFFVYPKLRARDAQPDVSTQVPETSSASGNPAAGQSSDSSAAPLSEPGAESASGESSAEREPEATLEAPTESAEKTTPIRQGRPAGSGESSGWSSPVKAKATRPADAHVSSVPEPVSSPPVSAADQGQVEPAREPAAAEPVPDPVDRSPAPAPEETETSQASPDRQPPASQRPAYEGPKKGVVIWTGEADKGMTVVIEGTAASTGQVQGALPGVACIVRLTAPNVAVTEGPGPRNGYRRISLRFNKKGRFSVPVEWEVLH